MELREFFKNTLYNGSKRAQLFTLTTLIFFILMLSVFFSFAIISTQYYEQQQSVSLSTGAINLITPLNSTASAFGNAAAHQALSVLTYYEYNASLRKGNLISNFSEYLSYLMENGILPNVPQGTSPYTYLKTAMGNLTFYDYNSSIIASYSQLGLQSINETNLAVYQSTSSVLTISYLENIIINQTGDVSKYSIPITINISLTNQPDLFYIEQGIIRYIKFGNIQNLTSVLANSQAEYGSTAYSSYGTVVYVANNGCPSYTPQQESSIILVANQLSNINTCANNFAGVITNVTGVSTQSPYLIYSSNIILSKYFATGQNIELYGPEREALNLQNLITAASSHNYFTSPFTSSYIQRSEDLLNGSNVGIFTISGYSRLAASFNGISNNIQLSPSSNIKIPVSSDGLTVSAWIMPSNTLYSNVGILSTSSGCGYNLILSSYTSLSGSDGCGDTYSGNHNFIPNTWYDAVLTVSNGATPTIKLYVNGNAILSTTGTWGSGTSWGTLYLGSDVSSGFFNGSIANIQIYNTTLTQNSVLLLNNRGIEGLPISNNGLVGWFTLNGNANDLSGQGSSVISSNVLYTHDIQGTVSTNVSYFNGASSSIPLSSSLFPNYPTGGTTTSYAATFSIWFKTTSDGVILGQESSPLSATPSGFVPAIYVGTNGDVRASLFWHGGVSDQIVSTTPYNNGQWHFLVDTYNNGQETLYIDGKEIGTQSQSEIGYSSEYYYQLGTGYAATWPYVGSNWFYFNGQLANAQIYDGAITPQQELSMYYSGIGAAPISQNSITGWFLLNGNINNLININQATLYPNNVVFSYYNLSTTDSLYQNRSSNLAKIPGLLSCTNTFNCYNANSSGVYISNLPLETGSKFETVTFNSNSFITANVPLSGNFALSFWLRLNGTITNNEIPIGLSGSNGIIISSISGSPTLGLTDGSNVLYANVLSTGTWVYVAASKSGSTYTIYTNNNPGNTLNMGPITIANLSLGMLSNYGEFFNGSLSNLQIYSNTITATQANQLYDEGITGSPLSGNLVAWYPLVNNCYNYTSSIYNCYNSKNITYSYFSGNYFASGYPMQTIENEWQALGFGSSTP